MQQKTLGNALCNASLQITQKGGHGPRCLRPCPSYPFDRKTHNIHRAFSLSYSKKVPFNMLEAMVNYLRSNQAGKVESLMQS